MSDHHSAARGFWSTRLAFIFAATGSAVGLGNIWKFPYITGEYGGGAFVLAYLVCIAVVGLPLLVAEIAIGRRGGSSPAASIEALAVAEGYSRQWRWVGSLGNIAAFLILTFYSVIGGWSMAYLWYALSGRLSGRDAEPLLAMFPDLLASPGLLVFWHTLFMLLVVVVVSRGIGRGIERTVSVLMPAMLLLLLALVVYAFTTPAMGDSLAFMFRPDFSLLDTTGLLTALGHAFFTLSLGMSVMLAYGSHLHQRFSIVRSSLLIAALDTVIALLAGVAIFAIVFSNGLDPDAGPGLIFKTIPLALGDLALGYPLAVVFFFLLLFAAWSSAISLLEPTVEALETRWQWPRGRGSWLAGGLAWGIGVLCALSFNVLAHVQPLAGLTLFNLLDALTARILLPLTGLGIALFAGWVLSRRLMDDELGPGDQAWVGPWRFLIRYVTPLLVLAVFLFNLR